VAQGASVSWLQAFSLIWNKPATGGVRDAVHIDPIEEST